jgi:hypothetical protein
MNVTVNSLLPVVAFTEIFWDEIFWNQSVHTFPQERAPGTRQARRRKRDRRSGRVSRRR